MSAQEEQLKSVRAQLANLASALKISQAQVVARNETIKEHQAAWDKLTSELVVKRQEVLGLNKELTSSKYKIHTQERVIEHLQNNIIEMVQEAQSQVNELEKIRALVGSKAKGADKQCFKANTSTTGR